MRRTVHDFSEFTGIKEKNLFYAAYALEDSLKYVQFKINKYNDSKRIISAPCSYLKYIQNKIKEFIEEVYLPRPYVHGFVNGRSIVSNARKHINSKWMLNIDLENFFGTIHFGRLCGVLQAKPFFFTERLSILISQLCVYDNSLPQGSPVSPILSNIVCVKMDRDLLEIAKEKKLRYTRYADDLTFSSITRRHLHYNGEIESSLMNMVTECIEQNGFKINSKKTNVYYGVHGGFVTGLRVSNSVMVPRKHLRQLRAILHKITMYGFDKAEEEFIAKYKNKNRHYKTEKPLIHYINGKLNFICMVNGRYNEQYRLMYSRYKNMLKDAIVSPLPISKWNYILICESNGSDATQGTVFQLKKYGLISCDHVITDFSEVFNKDSFTEKRKLKVLYANSDIDIAIMEADGYSLSEGFEANFGYHYNIGNEVIINGFPNYRLGDSGIEHPIKIVGKRTVSGVERVLVDRGIVAGNSGGPIFDLNGNVIGIAVTGAETHDAIDKTENHSFIPIRYIKQLKKATAHNSA